MAQPMWKRMVGIAWLLATLAATAPSPTAASPQFGIPGDTGPADDPEPIGGGLSDVDAAVCQRQITASVVAFDQVYYWNRLGAFEPQGMMYALERDVVSNLQNENDCSASKLPLAPGQVHLRRGKRPRPLVLRMNVGDCLTIRFKNLLASSPVDDEQPETRAASIHVEGLRYVSSVADGGFNIGTNPTGGVIMPGQTTTYTLYAEREGTYVLNSGGATTGGEGDGGSISAGLFGAVTVEPQSAEWYRSQVTQAELAYASSPYPLPAGSYPTIDYDKRYANTFNPHCYRAGELTDAPVLAMLNSAREIVHSDLTAVITGKDKGNFSSSTFTTVSVYPERNQPYREFTIIFHDEIGAVQAFPEFERDDLAHTLHSVRDAFAINYGAAGAGAEILANRIGVGPMAKCVDCMYEEFFLASWAVGDPAMVVDTPANDPCTKHDIEHATPCVTPGPKATKAFYPEDPSNVYHSYLNDHLKFRNLHAGTEDHHVFHLHAHQWLYSPAETKSSYKDSQAIGQGSSFTYEIAYGGSGNRNKTVGDSIFHCHLYPHFAQGMWALWRTHDTLELGTELDGEGRPKHAFLGSNLVTTARALPDAEILAGTPIPALVPIPTLPMAPLPAATTLVDGNIHWSSPPASNPGYPFFVAGEAGSRAPQPPLDLIDDGGLPRHVITGGTFVEEHDRLSFHKELVTANSHFLDPNGEPQEQVAMAFHEQSGVVTPKPLGGSGTFTLNGKKRVRGAPYADPCDTPEVDRLYKAANIQMDIVLNKAGWHFPQQRILTLWDDVTPTLTAQRAPEPFFFRAQAQDCIEYWHTNLVPSEYVLDDFQVRTPTDILGQHIHLVKFDVTSSDGGGNGFNYEDGTLSPEQVQDVIAATRAYNRCRGGIFGGDPRDNDIPGNNPLGPCPVVEEHPYFKSAGIDADCDGNDDWLGAQTTAQRWWADMMPDGRTLRTVFTHDHFGPSTHQQVGLYAGLIVEDDSAWMHNETGTPFYTRHDGGPTSWQAVIGTGSNQFREFMIEFADFQLAYQPNDYGPPSAGGLQLSCPSQDPRRGYIDTAAAINPPGRREVGLPNLYAKPDFCPTAHECIDGPPAPCPEAISADDPGFVSVNYRSEPLALRVYDPATQAQTATPFEAGDLSFAYESRTDRAISDLNGVTSPWVPYPNLTHGIYPGDPFTPLLRTFEGDDVRVRVLVGAHEEEHNFTINGMKWQHQPDAVNSGFRASQGMAISEWFDLQVQRQPSVFVNGDYADYLYRPSASNDFQWNGAWGLFRSYYGQAKDLMLLSGSNPDGKAATPTQDSAVFAQVDLRPPTGTTANGELNHEAAATLPKPPSALLPQVMCPRDAPVIRYDVVAVSAAKALPLGALVYNSRDNKVLFRGEDDDEFCPAQPSYTQGEGPLSDETAMLFVHRVDIDPGTNQLRPGVKIEPLILRARAGDCVKVTLTNEIGGYYDLPGYSGVPPIIDGFNQNQISPSLDVSLHPQLLAVDVRQSDGMNVGRNRLTYPMKQTVKPGESINYYWYAGDLQMVGGSPSFRPIELGATALVSADPIKHTNKGAIGALIVEPAGATWTYDLMSDPSRSDVISVMTRASATVTVGSKRFREFVTLFQDDINLRYGLPEGHETEAIPNLFTSLDPTEGGQDAFNYRTEPIWFRTATSPDTPGTERREFPNYHLVNLDSWINDEPQTPIYVAHPKLAARWRVVHPGGDTQNHVFEIQGHAWQEEPYVSQSTAIGSNPRSNWLGSRPSIGTGAHFDAVLTPGGPNAITGDYLYRDYVPWMFDDGLWGILRVDPTQVPSQVTPPEL